MRSALVCCSVLALASFGCSGGQVTGQHPEQDAGGSPDAPADLTDDASVSGEKIAGFTARDGVPHLGAALAAGEDVRVVTFGGSITRGGGEHGFSAQFPKWLQQRYPDAKVTAINAGINGSTSEFGAQRVARDVIAHAPDLVLVEFAVNDSENDANESIRGNMERIVRKLWDADTTTDIVFIYTLTTGTLDTYRAGELAVSARYHEEVAEHYGIPGIAFGFELARAIDTGELTLEEFAPDGTHPHEAGYAVYNRALEKGFDRLLEMDGSANRQLPTSFLTPDLVVYPPPHEAQPLEAPQPLEYQGQTAVTTYGLPIPGVHWVRDPVYTMNDGASFSLSALPMERQMKLNSSSGVDRSASHGPMAWLEEPAFFHGPENISLAYAWQGKAVLAAREKDMPVLSFQSATAGRHAFELKSSNLELWSLHESLLVNVIHFAEGEDTGTAVATSQPMGKGDGPLVLTGEADLRLGDELAFVVDANTYYGGGGAAVRQLDLRIGRME